MGLFDFGKRRRERERAMQPPDPEAFRSLKGDGQPIGQQVEHRGAGDIDLTGLAGLGNLGAIVGAIGEAARTGNFQVVQQQAQQAQAGGTELRERIFSVMRRHGIDPETGQVDGEVSDAAGLNQEIMEALESAGLGFGQPGGGSGSGEQGGGGS